MKTILLAVVLAFGSACTTAEPTKPTQSSVPQFVSVETSFKWYSAHRRGEIFEYLEDADGNRFVMTYDQRSASMLLPLMIVPTQREFGMMLDENLCSNGLAVVRGANASTYYVNIVPSFNEAVREAPPRGVCFTMTTS